MWVRGEYAPKLIFLVARYISESELGVKMQDFNKFTNYSQEILASAQNISSSYKNFELQPEHILMAMIKDVDGVSGDYLKELSLLKQDFIDNVVKAITNYPDLLLFQPF